MLISFEISSRCIIGFVTVWLNYLSDCEDTFFWGNEFKIMLKDSVLGFWRVKLWELHILQYANDIWRCGNCILWCAGLFLDCWTVILNNSGGFLGCESLFLEVGYFILMNGGKIWMGGMFFCCCGIVIMTWFCVDYDVFLTMTRWFLLKKCMIFELGCQKIVFFIDVFCILSNENGLLLWFLGINGWFFENMIKASCRLLFVIVVLV